MSYCPTPAFLFAGVRLQTLETIIQVSVYFRPVLHNTGLLSVRI